MMSAAFATEGQEKPAPMIKNHWLIPLIHGHVDQASAFPFLVP